MWVMIYWVCMQACVPQQLVGFSTEEMCKSAVERITHTGLVKVEAVCVEADMSIFE